MKKYLLVGTAFLCLVIGYSHKSGAQVDLPKVAIIAPMTGSAAVYGQWLRQGVDLAIARGVTNIQFEYLDSSGDPKTAVTLANKAVADQKTIAIWTVTSADTMAVRDIVSSNGVTLITSTATSPTITDGRKGVFRTIINSRQEAEALVQYAIEKLAPKKVAIFYINDAGGKASLEEFKSFFTQAGVSIEIAEPFEKNPQEMRTVVAKVVSTAPDAVIVTGYSGAMGIVVSNIRSLDTKTPILCNTGFDNPENLSLPPAVLSHIYFSIALVDKASLTISFDEEFRARFEHSPNIYEVTAHDTAQILSDAVKSGATKSRLDAALRSSDFKGQNGAYRFTKKGNVLKDVLINKVDHGQVIADGTYSPAND